MDVKNLNVGEAEHYMAILEVEGERQLIDLGPIRAYKVRLEPSTQITVRGVPVHAHEHRVLMAEQVKIGKDVIKVDRMGRRTF